MKVKIIFLLFFLISGLHAQVSHIAIPAAGGSASGGGGTLSYTLGQVGDGLIEDPSGNTLLSGIQQPYELFIINSVDHDKVIGSAIRTYPNPANDYVILKIQDDIERGYSLSIYDIKGELKKEKKVIQNETKISMEELLPSVYFIKVYRNKEIVKTFKIIKK